MSTFTHSASKNTTITNTNTTNTESKGVYIGADDDYDLYVGGAWTAYKGAKSGVVLPVRATGARHNSGSTAPDPGDIVFLHD